MLKTIFVGLFVVVLIQCGGSSSIESGDETSSSSSQTDVIDVSEDQFDLQEDENSNAIVGFYYTPLGKSGSELILVFDRNNKYFFCLEGSTAHESYCDYGTYSYVENSEYFDVDVVIETSTFGEDVEGLSRNIKVYKEDGSDTEFDYVIVYSLGTDEYIIVHSRVLYRLEEENDYAFHLDRIAYSGRQDLDFYYDLADNVIKSGQFDSSVNYLVGYYTFDNFETKLILKESQNFVFCLDDDYGYSGTWRYGSLAENPAGIYVSTLILSVKNSSDELLGSIENDYDYSSQIELAENEIVLGYKVFHGGISFFFNYYDLELDGVEYTYSLSSSGYLRTRNLFEDWVDLDDNSTTCTENLGVNFYSE